MSCANIVNKLSYETCQNAKLIKKIMKKIEPIDVGNYVIGIALEINPNNNGVKEALLEGFFINNFSEYKGGKIIYYETDGTILSMKNICDDFTIKSQDFKQKVFISSFSTTEFLTARMVLDESILVISLGSTLSNFPSIIQNGLSMLYSDSNASKGLVNVMLYSQLENINQRVFVIYFEDSLYSVGYKNNVKEALKRTPDCGPKYYKSKSYSRDNLETLKEVVEEIKPDFRENDILVFVGYPEDFLYAKDDIFNLATNFYIYGSDTMDGINLGNILEKYFYIVVPSFMDYTTATRELYKNLYNKYSNLLEFTSFIVPFSYDCARQIYFMIEEKFVMNLENFSLTKNIGIYQKAALETNWINTLEKRPFFGLYWFCQLYDSEWSEHIIDFRKLTLGSTITQPKSCAIGFKAGLAQWVKPSFYLLNKGSWQNNFFENKWIFTNLTLQGLEINTNNFYQSNNYENQNIGNFEILYQERYKPILIKKNDNDIVFVINDTKNNNYPLQIEKVDITNDIFDKLPPLKWF
jgi:hypothetical protein